MMRTPALRGRGECPTPRSRAMPCTTPVSNDPAGLAGARSLEPGRKALPEAHPGPRWTFGLIAASVILTASLDKL